MRYQIERLVIDNKLTVFIGIRVVGGHKDVEQIDANDIIGAMVAMRERWGINPSAKIEVLADQHIQSGEGS